MLGQCGPRVPRLKSLFSSSRYLEDVSSLQRDRQAELQLVWQEIGDDKYQKLEELQKLVSVAIHDIYERAMEENTMRKADLEDMVAKSEIQLKELLGPNALQVMASRDLPLQARLNINMTQLKAVESSRIEEYGWVGGLLVLVKLRLRIVALREMLKLPPCDNADLDEVLANTTEDLQNMCPKEITLMPSITLAKSGQKPIFQRMYQFYHTLCAIENVWMHCFAKDADKVHDIQYSATPVQECLQNELREMIARKSIPSDTTLGCSAKRSSSKIRPKSRESRHAKLCSDEAALEQLSNKILRKLDKINKRAKSLAQPTGGNFSPFSQCSWSRNSPSLRHTASFGDSGNQSVSVSPSSENDATTPTSVLPESRAFTPTPGYYSKDQPEALDACWAAQYASDLHSCRLKDANLENQSLVGSVKPNRLSNLFSSSNELHCVEETQANVKPNRLSNFLSTSNRFDCNKKAQPNPGERLPLKPITGNHAAPRGFEKVMSPMKEAPPHSLRQIPQPSSTLPPPPPPPPPPPSLLPRVKMIQSSRSAKLRKSPTISKLYLEMKKKIEGAPPSNCTDVAAQRRATMGNGSREGMAEALAEITRRSSYFRKIEDDVHMHAKSILMVKSRLEAFETSDMDQLMQFHADMEVHLEQLTDESQVLARFKGFPTKKLETIRSAASLHLKLSSIVQQIGTWSVEPPMSDQLEKVNSFFDKVKTDVEAIERTKEEDCQRFSCQKIHFNFETIISIKEAIVGLSSRCLASTLVESQRTKANMKVENEYRCIKDMTRLRGSFQMLYKAFLLAFRVHNFAGGHDDKAEQLSSELALEMESYPSSFWLELIK